VRIGDNILHMAEAIIENTSSKSFLVGILEEANSVLNPSVVRHNQTVRTSENLARVWTVTKRFVWNSGSGRPIGATFKGQTLEETSVTTVLCCVTSQTNADLEMITCQYQIKM